MLDPEKVLIRLSCAGTLQAALSPHVPQTSLCVNARTARHLP